jgi:antitoxin component YwqK of YwqJK toxin-antitoxin module
MAKVVRTYYDLEQTKLKEEYFEVNGKKEGMYKSYYFNGQLWIICNYIDGKINGEYKSYFDNGQLGIICNYIDGKINGEYKIYNMNGEFKICNYVDDFEEY